MVEGQDLAQVEAYANDIADAVRTGLGTSTRVRERRASGGARLGHRTGLG